MSKGMGKLLASAGSGLASGATGMYLYLAGRGQDEFPGDGATETTVISTPRSSPPLPAAEDEGSAIASDFIMPFVKRYGLPDLDQVILPSEEYTSCWDSRTRNARWVVERINVNTIMGPGDRDKSRFKPDKRIQPLFRSNLDDYAGSGYDRGHLAPAGDHKTTQGNLTQTFLLSNMAPQIPSFNRGYWGDFEEFVRTLVIPSERSIKVAAAEGLSQTAFKDVYVITGPLFLPSKEALSPATSSGAVVDADNGGVEQVTSSSSAADPSAKWVVKHDIIGNPMQMVAVPTHFFKVIIAEPYPPPPSEALTTTPVTFVAAFAMPNASIPNNTDLRNFLVPLDALESVSGMRFLGAVNGSNGLFYDDEASGVKVLLDKEALRVRAEAGVPALSGDWGGGGSGEGGGNGTQLSITGGEVEASGSTEGGRTRIFRHLCTSTSCRGL
eukprot:g13906.t1